MASALYIDADACPVMREALACARRARTPVVIVGNTTQNLARHIRSTDPRDAEHARGRDATHGGFWVDVVDVSVGADSADFAIVEQLQPGGNRRARQSVYEGDDRHGPLHPSRREEGASRRRSHTRSGGVYG